MRMILASTSPRRIELLGVTGLRFEKQSPGCEERVIRGESPRAMVRRLALEKAAAVAGRLGPLTKSALIISADTTVVSPDRRHVLNKPRNERDAFRMLNQLCGSAHEVLTGYCLWEQGSRGAGRKIVRVVSSRVRLRKISPAQIRAYIATGEPMDKAGAYAAQGIGMTLVESIRGSYTNVVGLPMAQLLQDLESEFGISALGGPGR
jgi:septum formation protein